MRRLTKAAVATLALALAAAGTAGSALATCKKMGFLVNDYGKDGPTEDAKNLLDKHVAEWAAKEGVTNYTIGKKDVTCELYLNLILFDEHTCTASANVCWNEGPNAAKDKTASTGDAADSEKPAKAKAAAKSDKAVKGDTAKKDDTAKDDNAANASEKAKSETPAASPVETGTLPATSPPAAEPTAADKAVAAAERAAQAAERAAAAAERAERAIAEKSVPAAPTGTAADAAKEAVKVETPSAPEAAAKVEPVLPSVGQP